MPDAELSPDEFEERLQRLCAALSDLETLRSLRGDERLQALYEYAEELLGPDWDKG